MMKLRYSPTSPFVRKITVLAHETGLHDKIERVPTAPWDPKTDLPKENPLGKVPALTSSDGIFIDSPVICEYLDGLHGGVKMFPLAGPSRWTALRLQAIADGMVDAGVSRLLESRRPAGEMSKSWIERQANVVARALDALEAEAGSFGDRVDIGTITVACALGWLTFRFGAENYLAARPKLAAWYGKFSQRPSMKATEPKDPV